MYKKNFLFIVFEGIEGSGKTYQSKKLLNNLKKKRIPVHFTREPGGTKSAEIIRRVILSGKKKKFNETTDTLLYLAARNEHIEKTLIPTIKKKNIICDRFTDSTLAYQVGGKNVDIDLVNFIHKKILFKIKPDLTILLTVNINKAFQRINKRIFKNRYDKFSKKFYKKVQNSFIKKDSLEKIKILYLR
jgi:dTMP kinase